MAKDLKHIPDLRFPEFKNSGEWNIIALEDVLDYEQPTKYIVESDNYKEEGTPVLTANKSLILGYTEELHNIYNTLPTIIFDDFTTDRKYIDFPFKVKSSAIKLLTVKGNREDNLRFIFEAMQLIPFEAREHKRHYISEFQKQKIFIPQNPTEQKKIAECLSSVDNYINATQDKIALLQSHKKGLMQQLLPALGKEIPQKRVSKFEQSKKWNPYSMKEMFEIKNGYTPSKSNPKFWENGTIPWFRMEDIREHGHILSDSIQHITKEAVKGKGLFPANSIIVATTATIGEHALIIVDSLANQQFTFLTKRKSFDTQINMKYFYYYMYIIDEWCKQHTNGGGFASIDMNGFKRLSVSLPSPEEQKEIAECFTSIDDLIDSTKQKLVMLQNHKRGLMQQLFPTV